MHVAVAACCKPAVGLARFALLVGVHPRLNARGVLHPLLRRPDVLAVHPMKAAVLLYVPPRHGALDVVPRSAPALTLVGA
eukprot:scaffold207767_cov30-Tisochrysis_lutea.AAC.3